MRKLLIGAALCSLFAVPGFAGEPAKLTSAQMDQVTAGNPCSYAFKSVAVCVQKIDVDQTAVAVAGGFSSSATAINASDADQVMGDFNVQEVNQ
jgi:hypothetical protein